jgi:hypothetical protein
MTKREEALSECWVCGKPALYAIQLAGEDEPVREEAACELHARGHVHRGLLTPAAQAESIDVPA